MSVSVIGFSGWSGTGKTFLLEKLVKELKNRGLKVAVIKHHAHTDSSRPPMLDTPEKDSWRFTAAGADLSIVTSAAETAAFTQRSLSLEEIIRACHGVDIILAEGFKNENIRHIGLARLETKAGFTDNTENFMALVCNFPVHSDVPVFTFDQVKDLADFILSNLPIFNVPFT